MLSLHPSVRKHTLSALPHLRSKEQRVEGRKRLTAEVRGRSQKNSGLGLALLVILALTSASRPLHAQQLNPIEPLYFIMPEFGSAPPSQVIEIHSSTGGVVQTYVSASTTSGGNWLHVSSGGYNNTPFPELVSVDPTVSAALPAGTYTGEVVVTPTDGTTPLTIPVNLTVAAPPKSFFNNLPGGLTFSLAMNGQPVSQTIEVSSVGGAGSLNWAVTLLTFNGRNWLTASSSSGTAPSLVTVGIVRANLPNGGATPGIYTGQLLFTSSTGSVTVPVTVLVGGVSLVQINPLGFTMPEFGNAPPGQVIEVWIKLTFLSQPVAGANGSISHQAPITTRPSQNLSAWIQRWPKRY